MSAALFPQNATAQRASCSLATSAMARLNSSPRRNDNVQSLCRKERNPTITGDMQAGEDAACVAIGRSPASAPNIGGARRRQFPGKSTTSRSRGHSPVRPTG